MPPDYLGPDDLWALGLDPDTIPARCPWATPLTALDGSPCWAAADLLDLLGGDA